MQLSNKKIKYIKRQASKKTPEEIAKDLRVNLKDVQEVLKQLEGESQTSSIPADTIKKDRETANKYHLIAILAIALLGIIIYSNTLNSPFIFDDVPKIKENPFIRITDFDLKRLYNAGFKNRSSYRPVANISFALNYYFQQYHVIGYHVVNIIIHILTGVFLYFFINATLNLCSSQFHFHRPATIAFVSALVWLVSPVQTQSVTYIVQRMNSMAAMFFVLAFLLYVKGRLVTERWKYWYFAGSVLAWLLALGCKQTSATLPFLVFLYEWYFFQHLNRDWLIRNLKYLSGIFILFGVIASIYLGLNPFEKLRSIRDFSNNEFTFIERVLTQFRVVIYYLSLLVYPRPSRLNLDYDFPLSHSLIDPVTTLLCMIAIIGLIGLAVYMAKKDRLLSFCIFWFFGNLAIESTVIPLAIIFEHRIYLPSMLVYLILVTLAGKHIKPKWLFFALFSVIVITFSLWTYERNSVWSDEVTLWKDCVAKSPQKARPHNNLGKALWEQGRTEEAIDHYLEALRIKPDYQLAHVNIGVALNKQDRTEEAIEHYLKVLRMNPDNEKAHYNLGNALNKQGRTSEAIEHYLKALRIKPDYEEAHDNLGVAFAKLGRTEEAIEHFSKALFIKPDNAEAHNNIGIAFAKQGRTEEAIAHFSKALQARPDYGRAHNNLGIALFHQGNIEDAIGHFREALRINPNDISAKNNLEKALMTQQQNK